MQHIDFLFTSFYSILTPKIHFSRDKPLTTVVTLTHKHCHMHSLRYHTVKHLQKPKCDCTKTIRDQRKAPKALRSSSRQYGCIGTFFS